MNKPKYVVVQEWINHSDLVMIERDGTFTSKTIVECDDLPNDYYAVMELEADGEFYNEVESFHTKEEAWELYDKLTKGE